MLKIIISILLVIALLILTTIACIYLGFEQQILAICALVLSTGLFIFKIIEVWNSQIRIDVAATTTSSEEQGHTIRIRNLSNKTFIITYWEVFISHPWEIKKNAHVLCNADYDDGDHRMDPYSTFILNFAQANYFSVSEKALNGKRIYIRICIAGSKSFGKQVYPF